MSDNIIRASNADKINLQYKAKKRGQSGQVKRTLEEMAQEITGEVGGPPPSKTQRVTKVDVKTNQRLNLADKERAAASNPVIQSKLAKIRRYLADEDLSPILRQNGDRGILSAKCSTEAEVDFKLDHIREVVGNVNPTEKLHAIMVIAAETIEKTTDAGAKLPGSPHLSGFASAVLFGKKEMQRELAEFRCEHGGLFTGPWWMRLAGTMAKIAYHTHQLNTGGAVIAEQQPSEPAFPVFADVPQPVAFVAPPLISKRKHVSANKGKGPAQIHVKTEQLNG